MPSASPCMQRYCTQQTTLNPPVICNISPQLVEPGFIMALQGFDQQLHHGDDLLDDAQVCLVLVLNFPDAFLDLMLLVQVVAEHLHLKDVWQRLQEGIQPPEAPSRLSHCK